MRAEQSTPSALERWRQWRRHDRQMRFGLSISAIGAVLLVNVVYFRHWLGLLGIALLVGGSAIALAG